MGPAEYTIFRDLMDTWNFWSLVVGIFTFLVMFYLIIKFREVSPDDKTPENLSVNFFFANF